MKTEKEFDYLIVGAGIIGLTIAYELIKRNTNYSICIIDKENDVAQHASGRNSGILHAGFYYTSDSKKAQHCLNGNSLMKKFCSENGIEVKATKKLVVTKSEKELEQLYEIKRRADANNVKTELISKEEAEKIEPNINTYKEALYSPNTASVDPLEVCNKLKENFDKIFNFGFTTTSGSGIGLYHVLQIVEKMNGTIEVNDSLEKGSEFIIKVGKWS